MKKSFVAIFACLLIFNAAYSLSLSSVNEHVYDHLTRDNSDENGDLNLMQNSFPHRIKRRYNNNLSNESDSAMQPGEMRRDSSVYLDFTNHSAHLEGDSSPTAAAVDKGRNNFQRSQKNTLPSTEKKAVVDSTPQGANTHGRKYSTWITKSEQEKERSVRSKNDVKRNGTERGLFRKGDTDSKPQLTNFEDDVVESGDEDDGFPNTDGDLGDDSIDNLFGGDDDLGDSSMDNLFGGDDDLGDNSADNFFSDEGDSLVHTSSEEIDNDLGDNILSAEDSDSLMDSIQDDLGDGSIDQLFTDDIDMDSGGDLFSIRGGDPRGDNLSNDGHYQSDNRGNVSLGDALVDSLTDEPNVLGSIRDDLPLDDPLDNVRSTYSSSSSNGMSSNSGGVQMDNGKKTDAQGKAIPSNANDSKGTEKNTVKSKDEPKGERNSTLPVEWSGTSRGVTTKEGPHIEERPPLDSVNKRGNKGEENAKEKNNFADASSAENRVRPTLIDETIKITANPNYKVNQTEGKEKKKRDTHPKGRGKKNRPSSKRRNARSYKVDRGETRMDNLSRSAEQSGKPTLPEGGAHSGSESPSDLSVTIELPRGEGEVKKAEAVMIPEKESTEEEKELSLLQMSAEKGDRAGEANENAGEANEDTDEANEDTDEANEDTDEAKGDPQDELFSEKVKEDKNLERFGEEETVENIASLEHPLIRRKKNIVKNSRKMYDLSLYNCTFIEDWDLNHEYMDEEGTLVKLSGYVFQNMVNSDLMPTANITDWKLKGSCDYDKYVCGALGYMNNVYSKGERVIFEGRVYEATSDAYGTPREMENVWMEKTDDCYDF
ncbi:hypothetical protein PCYB_122320 [Plasmodium cynomolgi strain B]|uniref:Secreted ookinete protein n=1 Tax=Plasmodium cynomolgi (strain B) TaxID=1120755 RepID=K6UYJ9_PLACD|nr:hypothetical protein PCYB_122320 [Plasmodium cynomolgi strain B]GAB67665.1 hypothetical protein PCYB_122320 [Plasmodium cynomolgi strain B]